MANIPLILLNLEDGGYHLLIEITVFDHTFRAVLDTGASKTVLDKQTIERYAAEDDIKLSEHLSTGLGTNHMESYTLVVPDLKIGTLHLRNYEVAVLDLSTINFAYESMEKEPVIGVIGGDLLQQYRAVIDYGKNQLSLKKPEAVHQNKGKTTAGF